MDECEFDGDCYPGKKCCSNTCFTRCLDPVGLSGSNGSLVSEGRAAVAMSCTSFLGGGFQKQVDLGQDKRMKALRASGSMHHRWQIA